MASRTFIAAALLASAVTAFQPLAVSARSRSRLAATVVVSEDAAGVADALCARVAEAAKAALAERGRFDLAIPGGSILKMLPRMSEHDVDWSKTTIAYVNHKCVEATDPLATHGKALPLFLQGWIDDGATVLTVDGTAGSSSFEAEEYAAKIFSAKVPLDDASGVPVFDAMLIGVGTDGHIGSLYPDRDEVMRVDTGDWVLPVAKEEGPHSVTLSLHVMNAARTCLVACVGASDKYPAGKAEAMARALEADEEKKTFPAKGLSDDATWLLDAAAAANLSPATLGKDPRASLRALLRTF